MTGLLLVAIDVPAGSAEEFHRWYDNEHVPERTAIEGFASITRWSRIDGELPEHLALFELASPGVLTSGDYAALKQRGDTPWTATLRPRFLRTVRRQLEQVADYGGTAGRALACAVAVTDVPGEDEDAYRQWYDDVHGPAVADVPGLVRMRRFEAADATTPRHVTVLELTSPEVLEGEAYAGAKARTPGDHLRPRWQRSQGVYRVRPAYQPRTFERQG